MELWLFFVFLPTTFIEEIKNYMEFMTYAVLKFNEIYVKKETKWSYKIINEI